MPASPGRVGPRARRVAAHGEPGVVKPGERFSTAPVLRSPQGSSWWRSLSG